MRQQYDVTLVTYADFPQLVPDDKLLRDALVSRGASVRAAVWTDRDVDWSTSPVTVCRSMWDYFHHVDRFKLWLQHVESTTTLINPVDTVRWNMHKGYLAQLEAKGVAIVPTHFVTANSKVELLEICIDRQWNDVVVKPAISGSAVGARRFRRDAFATAGQAHLTALSHNADAMIQPYMMAVEREGERAVTCIGGAFSHAVVKAPFSAGAARGESQEQAYRPDPCEVAFATRVAASLDVVPTYARVDFVPTPSGPALMELELIEPNLFLRFSCSAAGALATLILAAERPAARR